MRKSSFLILFFLIFLSFFFTKEALATQEAYIVLIEYSVDDPFFCPYNHAGPLCSLDPGKGVIAWVEDTNGSASGGKIYKVAPGVSTKSYTLGSPHFDYQGDRIAIIDTINHSRLYTRYTVKNTGDDPIEGLLATMSEDIYWGTATKSQGWGCYTGSFLRRLGFLSPGETDYEIYYSTIENFPKGYLWKQVRLGWPSGQTLPNEKIGYKAMFYTDADGNDFSPPTIDCEDPDQEIAYGETYTHTCTYHNPSSNTVHIKLLGPYFFTRLAGTWGTRYTPAEIPEKAEFYDRFGEEIISLAPGETLAQDITTTINEIYSPLPRRNVNLSSMGVGRCHLICLDSVCSQQSRLYRCFYPIIGYGAGKYLAITDSGTFSKTVMAENGKPAYDVYFNLRNPDNPYTASDYNETVGGKDYYIDIQIIKDEDKENWYLDGSTAVRQHAFLVEDLEQESDVEGEDIFPGIFDADDGHTYPFFYRIPDIHQIPSEQLYMLYITTIWRNVSHPNHPLAGQDEPIDQIFRSFAPGLDLEFGLSEVRLPAAVYDLTVENNYIRNFSSFDLTVKVELSENVPQFSITGTSLPPGEFFLAAGDELNFSIDFQYSGSKPKNDVHGDLFGTASIKIAGEYRNSDTASVPILIEKSGPPTAHDLNVTPPNPTDYCWIIGYPPVRVNWTFFDPGDTQSAFKIEVDDNSDFSSPEVETGKVNGDSGSYVFQQAGEQLSWGKTYYWRLKVTDSENNTSNWIYPPNPSAGPVTPSPGTPFITTHPWPEPDFEWLPAEPTAAEIIQFTDLSQFHDSSQSWFWDFGDGQSSTSQNPIYAYPLAGMHNVTLTATDSDNYSCDLTKTVKVGLPLPGWKEIPPF